MGVRAVDGREPRIPVDYFTFGGRPFRWRMGLRPLDLADWLEVDDHWEADRAEKRRLLAAQPDDVFAAEPRTDAAGAEVEDAVLDALAGQGRDPGPSPAGHHPLLRAALAVQEDLLLMQRDEQGWRLTAGSLSFPTNWHLGQKMGRDLDDIHAPVPRYADDLGGAVPDFFDRLAVDRPVWRANWSVTDDPGLRLEAGLRVRPHRPLTPDQAGATLHLRVERQTLRRFPRTDAVLFTVRIHRQPIATLVDQPEVASRLADGLAGLPDDVGAYKDSTSRWAEPLITWLRGVS